MILEDAAAQVPGKIFIHEGEQHFSFETIEAQAQRFAHVLSELGVQPGDTVALLLPNVVLFPICQYGALKLGGRWWCR